MKITGIISSFIGILARLAVSLVLVIAIIRLGGAAYEFGYRVFSEPPMTYGQGIDITVDIPTGSDPMDIGKILKNRGLIRDERLFFLQERLSSYHGELRPGRYTFSTSETAEDMMKKMAEEAVTEEDGDENLELPE